MCFGFLSVWMYNMRKGWLGIIGLVKTLLVAAKRRFGTAINPMAFDSVSVRRGEGVLP